MMQIKPIIETDNFIIVSKPAEVNFHDEGELGLGFFNQVKQQLGLAELYPVHRLDKMTSGLLLMAKTKIAAAELGQGFEQHSIQKYYLAISGNKPKKKQGLIKGDMAKARRGAWKLLHSLQNPAITQFFSFSIGDGKRLFLLKPHTGKTHQLRVALASIAAPILGDPLYAKAEKSQADRGYLHAFALDFYHQGEHFQLIDWPASGECFCELDEEIKSQLATPWQLNWPNIKLST